MSEPSASDVPAEPDRQSAPAGKPGGSTGRMSITGPVSLRVRQGPLAAPALGRVVSMMLARADCPLDKLDDALILCDALTAHAIPHANDGHISFTLEAESGGLQLRVDELGPGGASGLVHDARLPDVGNVIERFSAERRVEPATDGRCETLVLRFAFA